MKRLFSAVQPSGELHIGNYIGAIKQFVELQKDYDSIFSVVDYHAITVPQDPRILKENIRRTANTYLAAGLDPVNGVIFVQSDLSEHTELGWIFNTLTHMGELERMTQFKDKSNRKNEAVSVGLFDYPVLMASDILLYDTEVVPVGEDQKQHVEFTRDIAARFNKRFGETFKLPDPLIKKTGGRIMGLDNPTKKMSKSADSPNNYISLFDTEENVKKKIARAVTDSDGSYSTNEPGISNLITIYGELTGQTTEKLRSNFEHKLYSEFKKALVEVVVDFLKIFQKRFDDLERDPEYTKKILSDGAERAQKIASEKLAEAKDKIGVGS